MVKNLSITEKQQFFRGFLFILFSNHLQFIVTKKESKMVLFDLILHLLKIEK